MNIDVETQDIVEFILQRTSDRCFLCGGLHGGGRLATRVAYIDSDSPMEFDYKRYLCNTCSYEKYANNLSEDHKKEILESNVRKYEDLPYADFARKINEIFNREMNFRNLLK